MSRLAALRVLLAVAAVSALAACASPTAPTTSRLRSVTVSHDVTTDTTCRSGYTTGQGFHC
jgi:hypothetical protein